MPVAGLYYPYMHFRDDNWLKLAALSWDSIARIVPQKMWGLTDDSDTVRVLTDAGFVDNVAPGMEPHIVGDVFRQVLEHHQAQLLPTYHVSTRHSWPVGPKAARQPHKVPLPLVFDPRVAYVETGKMSDDVRAYLVETGFARLYDRFEWDKQWLAMHPRLADVYMTALARVITAGSPTQPLADGIDTHAAIAAVTVEDMARALLRSSTVDQTVTDTDQPEPDLRARYLALAFESIQLANLADADVAKIVKLREETDYVAAYRAFQRKLDELTTQACLEQLEAIANQDIRNSYVRRVFKKELKEPLQELRGRIGGRVGEAVPAVLTVVVTLANVGATGGVAIANAALGLIPSIRERQVKVRSELRQSPAAWLIHLEENLNPANALTRVKRRMRRFAHGI